jgi:phosphoribosylformylglycinamidine synthase
VLEAAVALGVPAAAVGRTGGDALILPGGGPISMGELRRAREDWLPDYMGG